jgi:hypothetical protein
MHAHTVESSEFTQLSSVEALINLYKIWNPVSIYVDAGNGSTNFELIRKMSYDQRRPGGDQKIARLLDIVKRYDSGASIETKDPVTGEKRRVPAKPYMVNSAVRAFEQDKMRISAADKTLEKQFRNYIIERISPTGTPVYGMRDKKVVDHRLDAFNLAMVGFFKEFGGLQQETVILNVGAAVNPMTKRMGDSRSQKVISGPEERRLDEEESKSVLHRNNGVAGRMSIGHVKIAQVNTGYEYDLEDEYHARYLQRQRRKARVGRGNNPIRRSNI